MTSPFRTWTDVPAHDFAPGVSIHAIGGERVLMCRVEYSPGAVIPLHDHPDSEQLVYLVDGDLTMTIDGATREMVAGDLAVVGIGVPHELTTRDGCVFIEALSPLPRDHVPDPDRDLVLGPDGARHHVER